MPPPNEVHILFIRCKRMSSQHDMCCVIGGQCQRVHNNHGPSTSFFLGASGRWPGFAQSCTPHCGAGLYPSHGSLVRYCRCCICCGMIYRRRWVHCRYPPSQNVPTMPGEQYKHKKSENVGQVLICYLHNNGLKGRINSIVIEV